VLKTHGLLHHSTLGLRVINRKKKYPGKLVLKRYTRGQAEGKEVEVV
jgi:hypothetical protein